jgi:hypothetical protein
MGSYNRAAKFSFFPVHSNKLPDIVVKEDKAGLCRANDADFGRG